MSTPSGGVANLAYINGELHRTAKFQALLNVINMGRLVCYSTPGEDGQTGSGGQVWCPFWVTFPLLVFGAQHISGTSTMQMQIWDDSAMLYSWTGLSAQSGAYCWWAYNIPDFDTHKGTRRWTMVSSNGRFKNFAVYQCPSRWPLDPLATDPTASPSRALAIDQSTPWTFNNAPARDYTN